MVDAARFKNRLAFRLVSGALAALAASALLSLLARSAQAAPITQAQDYISSDAYFKTDVSHHIAFKIPAGGHTIVPSDYVRITLPNFTSVTAPTGGGGWSGAPSYGVIGNTAYVTGISAAPGDWVNISGIRATNPGAPGLFNVNIDVSNDLAGNTIYDSTSFQAAPLKGTTTVSVTIGAPTAALTLSGYSSPGAFIRILVDGSVVGTTTADALGAFTKTINGIDAGNRDIEILTEDAQGTDSSPINFQLVFFSGIDQNVSNLVTSPTINLDSVWVAKDSTFLLYGYGTPGAQVTFTVTDTTDYQFVVVPDGNGYWSYLFDTVANPLSLGTHQTFANQIVPGGYQSSFSPSLNFDVLECSSNIADINCDGRVNLTDFSIMMFYWKDINPANKRTDLNNDNVVNLTDFSILLFNWTG